MNVFEKRYPIPQPGIITLERVYPLGTSYDDLYVISYRYACAGEDLKAMQLVESGLRGKVELTPGLPDAMQCNELWYGDIVAAKEILENGVNILGWPTVDVKKSWHFWLQTSGYREVPVGAKFVSGADHPAVTIGKGGKREYKK